MYWIKNTVYTVHVHVHVFAGYTCTYYLPWTCQQFMTCQIRNLKALFTRPKKASRRILRAWIVYLVIPWVTAFTSFHMTRSKNQHSMRLHTLLSVVRHYPICSSIIATHKTWVKTDEHCWDTSKNVERSWRTDVVHIDTCVIISAGLVQCMTVHAVNCTRCVFTLAQDVSQKTTDRFTRGVY